MDAQDAKDPFTSRTSNVITARILCRTAFNAITKKHVQNAPKISFFTKANVSLLVTVQFLIKIARIVHKDNVLLAIQAILSRTDNASYVNLDSHFADNAKRTDVLSVSRLIT